MILCEFKDGVLVLTDQEYKDRNSLRKAMRKNPSAFREDYGYKLIDSLPPLYIESTIVTKIIEKAMEI